MRSRVFYSTEGPFEVWKHGREVLYHLCTLFEVCNNLALAMLHSLSNL